MDSSEVVNRNRRISRRKSLKTSAQIRCRADAYGMGPNVAVVGIDLSETGARVRVKNEMKKGQEIEVELMSLNLVRPIKLNAEVVWCTPAADGTYLIGAHFIKRLDYADLARLTS